MGLDNGIIVCGVTRKDLPKFIKYPHEKDYIEDGVEICYWRKCWGLRNVFLKYFPKEDGEEEKYEYKLDKSAITYFRSVITYYLKNPNKWDDSIWSIDEIRDTLLIQRRNLFLIEYWMNFHPDKEIYFYDSY